MTENRKIHEHMETEQYIFLKDFLFYLFDRDSQREREHKQGEWERKKQAPSGGRSLMWGSISQRRDHALSRRQTLNRCATQAPQDDGF